MRKIKFVLLATLLVATSAFIGVRALQADPKVGGDKVFVCHDGNTIEISTSALPAHLAHGDAVGGCGDDCYGETHPEVLCFMVYDPVCGCDGNTYGNSCLAYVAGILDYTPGECGK